MSRLDREERNCLTVKCKFSFFFATFHLYRQFQRLYGKYLRAESFRKSLIYQKKYLLLLLGGFQDTEEASLALIAKMGGYPNPANMEQTNRRSKAFTKFRSAVRVCIAISR